MKTHIIVPALECERCGYTEITEDYKIPKIEKCIICGKDVCNKCGMDYEAKEPFRPTIRVCYQCLARRNFGR